MAASRTLFTSADTRCWTDDVDTLVLSFEQQRPQITTDVLAAIERAVDAGEREFATLVIASSDKHFALGANLDAAFDAAIAGRTEVLDQALQNYQRVMLRLRHASIPTIAAVRGLAISGGCELLMHCTRVVAHPESRIGLLEASVGILPGGGGLKEFALRASMSGDRERAIRNACETISAATITRTALDAQRLGFLSDRDLVDAASPLDTAIELGLSLAAAGHVPPPANPSINVVGSRIERQLVAAQSELQRHGKITEHQLAINSRVARVLCGDDGHDRTLTEADMLALERVHFVALAQTSQTQARIAHLRRTGELLAN
jgi:3-hydroxyacyl-CoA dehydrogenase